MTHKVMVFVDGENLLLRYEAMCKAGSTPKEDVIYEQGVCVWHPGITNVAILDIVRISYYQTIVGDNDKVDSARSRICNIGFRYCADSDEEYEFSGNLVPKIFKKESKSSKTKSVDINLTVDMLRHAYTNSLDVLFLLSGDGDYLPLIEEVNRQGKQVWLAAFSNGFNKSLRYSVDEFFCLDKIFFDISSEK